MEVGVEILPYEEAVRRGAAWLDENFPGWPGKINRDEIAMWSLSQCIVGQLDTALGTEGDPEPVASKLNLEFRTWFPIPFGFEIPNPTARNAERSNHYEELGRTWRALLDERR